MAWNGRTRAEVKHATRGGSHSHALRPTWVDPRYEDKMKDRFRLYLYVLLMGGLLIGIYAYGIHRREQAQQERKKAIEAAVADAEQQGLAEVKELKAKAEKDRSDLHDKLAVKISDAAAKVTEYLKG